MASAKCYHENAEANGANDDTTNNVVDADHDDSPGLVVIRKPPHEARAVDGWVATNRTCEVAANAVALLFGVANTDPSANYA